MTSHFRAQSTAKEWLDPSPPSRDGVFFPGVPTYLVRIMYRLRMDCWRTMFVSKSCVCGGAISFHHVLFNCRECSAHFAPVTSSLTSLLCMAMTILVAGCLYHPDQTKKTTTKTTKQNKTKTKKSSLDMYLASSETERYGMTNGSCPLVFCLRKSCRGFEYSYTFVPTWFQFKPNAFNKVTFKVLTPVCNVSNRVVYVYCNKSLSNNS